MKHLLMGLLLTFASAYPGLPRASADDASAKVIRDLQACVDEVLERFPNAGTDLGKLARAIEADANLITDKWSSASNKTIPSDYLRTLAVDCELIHEIGSEKDEGKVRAVLKDVSYDLNVKAAHAKKVVGLSEALGATIKVTVKTRKNGHEVEGYLVRCNPARYATNSPAMFVFNNPTNRAERSLPPGNYVFWLETQGGEKVASRPITIGGNGENSEPPILFDVP